MLTRTQFEEKYSKEIKDLGLSGDEIFCNYCVYAEDPYEFTASMISEDYGQFVNIHHEKMGHIKKV